MKKHKLVLRLKGGLCNQMFQYAAGFAMATRNGLELVLDTHSGFARDRVYRRNFSLAGFHLDARCANSLEQMPFLLETLSDRYISRRQALVQSRPWGFHVEEKRLQYYSELITNLFERNVWLDGYWQSEKYFKEIDERIAEAFQIRPPKDDRFISLAKEIEPQNAVAIGIRLYEEAPPGAHDTVPLIFYEKMAHEIAKIVEKPIYYLFCTVRQPIHEKLHLPGEVHYITHDDGYNGELNRLWLLLQFKYHIISNSSFYWWGAWLAEKKWPRVKVFASDMFPNSDTIPERWTKAVAATDNEFDLTVHR